MSDFDTLIKSAFSEGYYGDGHDTPREYTTFLGCVVESFDANCQWTGGNVVDMTLYEDFCGDEGRPPAVFGGARQVITNGSGEHTVVDIPLYNTEDMIGAPYRFSMGQFEFCGLLQRIGKTDSQDGKQEWKVQLVSPDQGPSSLVSRIQLVISGYYNDLGLDNIFNVGKEVEDQKIAMIQSYQWWNQWLQDEYANYLSLEETKKLIDKHGLQWVLGRIHLEPLRLLSEHVELLPPEMHSDIIQQLRVVSMKGLMDKVKDEYIWLQHIMPTVYGSLYYQEIIWAFNKLQHDMNGVRFNHRNLAPHPDLLIEDGLSWDGRYFVDISELPGCRNSIISSDKVPQCFSIKEQSLTLDDFVRHVCGDEGFRLDYIWELRPSEVKRFDIQLEKLQKIRNTKEQALNGNKQDPYPDIDFGIIDKEIQIITEERANTIASDDYFYRLPVLKLKVFPQGNNMLDSSARQIVRTIEGLQQQGIGITNHSIGLECSNDMPSIVLSGGSKEIMVVAGNNLLSFSSYVTGNPLYPGQQQWVVPTQTVINHDYPPLFRHDYPSVWRMYFGQDRYNNPQVMFAELHTLPINFYAKTSDTISDETTYQINSVLLDTYELQTQLKFFVNQTDFILPDYIKVSESEIRCSIDFDLFWWSVGAVNGDLCKLFVTHPILNPLVIASILLHDSTAMANTISKVLSAESADQMKVLMTQMMINRVYEDKLNNVGRCPIELKEMIHEDLRCIQKWINDKYTSYYGKQYVTPFYFNSAVEMYDEDGNYLQPYEPQGTGFREYGGTDFLGLRQHNTLMDGIRGLETFTEADGKTTAFVRFYDPERTIDVDELGINDIVRSHNYDINGFVESEGDFLFYKVQNVSYIRSNNLVQIELASPVFERLSITGPPLGAIDPEQMVNFLIHYENQLPTQAERDKFRVLWTTKMDVNGFDDLAFRHIYHSYMASKTNVGASYSITSVSPKAKFPIDGCYGVKCRYVHYGPWILMNGKNPGKYESDDSLTPWQFGARFMDPEEAHIRMNNTGLLKLATQMATHKYAHIAENGKLSVAGYPAIKLGAEIANLIDPNKQGGLSDRDSISFGGLYGIPQVHKYPLLPPDYGMVDYGDRYKEYTVDEEPYNGKNGPNVTRITVNVDGQGGITTSYDMSKNTAKDGMMAKPLMDKIQRSSGAIKGRSERINKEIERRLEIENARHAGYKSRKNSFDVTQGGRRTNTFSPHNMLIAQNISESRPYIDPETGKMKLANIVRGKAESGVSSVDVTHLMETSNEYLQKAVMSVDGLFAPYSTHEVKEGALLDQELRRELAVRRKRAIENNITIQKRLDELGNQNPELAQVLREQIVEFNEEKEEQAIRAEVISQGISNIPYFRKPTITRSTLSVNDGPKFLTQEALEEYNKQGGMTPEILAQMTPGYPINNQFLNPLINPAEIDNNDLMTHHVGKASGSRFGHMISNISRGLVRQDYINFVKNLESDNSPYSVYCRGIGLQGPVVITQWGYNTNNQPIPRSAADINFFSENFAARKDLHATGPLDIRFDEDRGVWTIPTPRMYYVVLLEDMKIVDVSAKNEQEEKDFWDGYDRGKPRGEEDKQTEIDNLTKPVQPLDAREEDKEWYNEQPESVQIGYNLGYEHGFHDLPRPKRVAKPNKRVFGPAKILNPKNRIEGFINVDTLTDTPMRKGEKCLAWQDGADVDDYGMPKYYAIPTGITMNTGVVVREIEPTGDLDENGELTGGGWVSVEGGSGGLIRAYCGMVRETSQSIPSGAIIEYLVVNSVARIINRLC